MRVGFAHLNAHPSLPVHTPPHAPLLKHEPPQEMPGTPARCLNRCQATKHSCVNFACHQKVNKSETVSGQTCSTRTWNSAQKLFQIDSFVSIPLCPHHVEPTEPRHLALPPLFALEIRGGCKTALNLATGLQQQRQSQSWSTQPQTRTLDMLESTPSHTTEKCQNI